MAPRVSSPMPQFTAEEASVEEIDDEDEYVDIGCTTPILNDDYWESHHPNSPLFTLLQLIPQSPVHTEEIHTGSEEHETSLLTILEEVPATSTDVNVAEEMETQAAVDDIVPEIPQPAAVQTITHTPQPKPTNPFSKK